MAVCDLENNAPGANETSPLLRSKATAAHIENAADPESPVDARRSKSTSAIISLLLIGVFISNLDSTLVLATCSTIASEFDHLETANWVTTSYTLATVACQPLTGRLSDVYGRKAVVVWSYAIFAVGVVVSGLGGSIWQVLLGRVISGIGGAGMGVIVTVIITDLVPRLEVAQWRSYVNVFATLGRSLGGPLGGWMADAFGWKWSLMGQAPPIILAIVLVVWGLPEKSTYHGSLKQVDFLGAGLLSTSSILFLLALDLTATYWWAWIMMGASVLLAIAFYLYERQVELPVFPLRLLSNRSVVAAYTIQFCQFSAQVAMMFTVPLYFQVTENASNTKAGAYLFSAVLGNTIGGLITGVRIKRTGRYRGLSIFGCASAMISYLTLLLTWNGHTTFLESLEVMPGGFGTGVAAASSFIILTARLPQKDIATATSGMFLVASLAMAVGVTIVSCVQKFVARQVLFDMLDPKMIEAVLSDVRILWKLPEPQFSIAQAGLVTSLEMSHVVSCVFAFFAFIVSLTVRNYSLTEEVLESEEQRPSKITTSVSNVSLASSSSESSSPSSTASSSSTITQAGH